MTEQQLKDVREWLWAAEVDVFQKKTSLAWPWRYQHDVKLLLELIKALESEVADLVQAANRD